MTRITIYISIILIIIYFIAGSSSNFLHLDYNTDLPIPDTKAWIEHIQNYPYPRDELITRVKILIDEIQLLKGLKDISRGYIFNSLTGFYIDARTPDSELFDKWLITIYENIDSYSDNQVRILYQDLLRLKSRI